MVLFYVIDAVAIYAVLKQYPHDSDAAVGLQHCLLKQFCCIPEVID